MKKISPAVQGVIQSGRWGVLDLERGAMGCLESPDCRKKTRSVFNSGELTNRWIKRSS